jgi:multiple sugar transport system substrate-binding protein
VTKAALQTSFILLLGLSFAILASGSKSGNPVPHAAPSRTTQPTRVYFADHISPTHQKAIDIFNRRHQGRIEVIPVNLPFSKFTTNERKELLARSLRSKSEKLDVFAVDLIWVSRFAKWAEPLDAYFTGTERERLLSYALQSCAYRGSFVAAPMYIDIGLMYYRRDIIARLQDASLVEQKLINGITWEELLNLRSRLKYGKKSFYIFQGKDYEGLVCNFLEMRAALDTTTIRRNTLDLSGPSSISSLRMMSELLRTGAAPREICDFDENTSYRYMLDHDAPFVRGWPNFIENFRSFYSDTTKLSLIGHARVPRMQGGTSRSVFGGWNFMVSKSSARKAEAIEFIKFMQSEEVQRILFEHGGYIPILNSLYENPNYIAAHQELAFYRRLLADGFHRPSMEEYTKVSDIVSQYINRTLRGEFTPEEAAKRANAMIHSGSPLVP